MEDGIENYTSMLIESTNRDIQSVNNETQRLYIYVPDNICNNINNIDCIFENIIISDDKEKIMDLSDKKKGKLLIFKKDSTTSSKYTKIENEHLDTDANF
jgi:hypothetical protein